MDLTETYSVTDTTGLLLFASIVDLHCGDLLDTESHTREGVREHHLTVRGPAALMHSALAAEFTVVNGLRETQPGDLCVILRTDSGTVVEHHGTCELTGRTTTPTGAPVPWLYAG